MPSTPPAYAWMNGSIIPWEQCVLHGRSQGAFFGANVFEGIRAYWNSAQQELYVFKLDEHMQRLGRSMKTMRLEVPFSLDQIAQGSLELLRANRFREDVHYIPVVYCGIGINFDPLGPPEETGVYITAIASPQKPLLSKGASACVSSWRRISDDTLPPRVKAGANYGNSRLAQREARENGYDTAVILNQNGKVAEAPGACLMMVRDGRVVTPPVTAGILESITRSTLLELFERELGVPAIEREVDRTELYVADEIFFCGSGWEVLPVVALDHITIGDGVPGPLTRRIQEVYFAAARGENPSYRHWLTPVYGAESGGATREAAAARQG